MSPDFLEIQLYFFFYKYAPLRCVSSVRLCVIHVTRKSKNHTQMKVTKETHQSQMHSVMHHTQSKQQKKKCVS